MISPIPREDFLLRKNLGSSTLPSYPAIIDLDLSSLPTINQPYRGTTYPSVALREQQWCPGRRQQWYMCQQALLLTLAAFSIGE